MNDRTNGVADVAKPHDDEEPQKTSHAKSGGTRAQERIAGLDASAPAAAAESVGPLTDQLEAATRALEEAEAGWQRSRADFANFKRRTELEQAESAGRANDMLLLKVVGLADDFDLAIEHAPEASIGTPWMEGIRAIDRKLRQLLDAQGVRAMQAEGQPFDPHEHQAISYEETADALEGTVLRELQRGYYIGDRVLRPAFVAVASNDHTNESEQASDTDKE